MFYFYFPEVISNLTQEYIGHILDNIKSYKSYYVGSSLCVDNILPHSKDVLVLNLDEMYFGFAEGNKRLLSIANVKRLFAVYEQERGKTDYYIEKLNKSCIRHLID